MIVWVKNPLSEDELTEISFSEPLDPENWIKLCTPDHLSQEIQDDLVNLSAEFKKKRRKDLASLALEMAKEIRKRANISIQLH